MIQSVKIRNYKSIRELSLEIGRVNVIIGENGCGKTNILEAIVYASAASKNVLSPDYLGRQLRLVAPEFMTPAFADIEDDSIENKTISITIQGENQLPKAIKAVYDTQEREWFTYNGEADDYFAVSAIQQIYKENKSVLKDFSESQKNEALIDALERYDVQKVKELAPDVVREVKKALLDYPDLKSFTIYTPEESKLRLFADEAYTYPLGRRGEGLFQYLKEIHVGEKQHIVHTIIEKMSLFDWFDGAGIPDNLLSNEYRLKIGDKYLKESLHYFDQRSTNEGFLFLLFYMTLFASPDTPTFFAIDNIESSFNPKLCTKLIRTIVELAKQNNKQVILTTHSPYVLDGLDLSDEEQRLFVAKRNRDGHTQIKRIPFVDNLNMHLSEVWMKGMIGGLPDSF